MSQRVSDRFPTRSREFRDNWHELAACQDSDIDLEGRVTKAMRDLCDRCPVALDCLREALDLEIGVPAKSRIGIRGGKTARERWLLQRRLCIGCQGKTDPAAVNRVCDDCREERRHDSRTAFEDRRRLTAS